MTSHADSTVMALKDLHLEGNIIPMEWFAHLKFNSGKPDVNAILILSDIVYWYRPVVIRDEQTGIVTGYRKKFKSDLLQKSYQQYADLFGLSKRQVSDAIIRLEEKGLIKRVLRSIETPSMTLQNILFLALNVQKLAEINAGGGGIPIDRDTPPDRKGDLSRSIGTPPPIDRDTYTEITTKITTETPTHLSGREKVSALMLEVWNKLFQPPVPLSLTSSRSGRLQAILAENFQGKMEAWEQFCQEIQQSSFLMGQGPRGWRMTLDWVLVPQNLQKILEGNYRNEEESSPETTLPSWEEVTLKAKEQVASLTDSHLQQFCGVLLRYLHPKQYLQWFSEFEIEGWNTRELRLIFPSLANRNYVQQKFTSEMNAAARRVSPESRFLTCDFKGSETSAASRETPEKNSKENPDQGLPKDWEKPTGDCSQALDLPSLASVSGVKGLASDSVSPQRVPSPARTFDPVERVFKADHSIFSGFVAQKISATGALLRSLSPPKLLPQKEKDKSSPTAAPALLSVTSSHLLPERTLP